MVPPKIILKGDKTEAAKWISFAKNKLATLKRFLNGVNKTLNIQPNVLIRMSSYSGIDTIYIEAGGIIPWSFRCLPASDSAPAGWGAPITDSFGIDINPPLGTVGGTPAEAVLKAKNNVWSIKRRSNPEAGEVDWQGFYSKGKATKVISYHGSPSRITSDTVNDEGLFDVNIYEHGSISEISPLPVRGAALTKRIENDVTVVYIIAIVSAFGAEKDTVIWKPYNKSKDPSYYDAMTAPDGWKILIEYPYDAANYEQAVQLGWFFNGDGTEAVTVRNFSLPGEAASGINSETVIKITFNPITEYLTKAGVDVHRSHSYTETKDAYPSVSAPSPIATGLPAYTFPACSVTANWNYDESDSSNQTLNFSSRTETVIAADFKDMLPVYVYAILTKSGTVTRTAAATTYGAWTAYDSGNIYVPNICSGSGYFENQYNVDYTESATIELYVGTERVLMSYSAAASRNEVIRTDLTVTGALPTTVSRMLSESAGIPGAITSNLTSNSTITDNVLSINYADARNNAYVIGRHNVVSNGRFLQGSSFTNNGQSFQSYQSVSDSDTMVSDFIHKAPGSLAVTANMLTDTTGSPIFSGLAHRIIINLGDLASTITDTTVAVQRVQEWSSSASGYAGIRIGVTNPVFLSQTQENLSRYIGFDGSTKNGHMPISPAGDYLSSWQYGKYPTMLNAYDNVNYTPGYFSEMSNDDPVLFTAVYGNNPRFYPVLLIG